ncbi:MAG: acyltransferase [Janibacter sp.]|nr:acyltransferase [Janibacter sp.]
MRTPPGHIAALTGLRGFAALAVVFVHGSGRTDYPWFGLHGYGPIALFVLSGFLLIQPWSKWAFGIAERPSIRSFARRRIWRIFPAYIVGLLTIAVLLPSSRPEGAAGWGRALALTPTTRPTGLRPGMEHTWSLATELSWYVALPVIGFVIATLTRRWFPRHPRAVIGAVLAISIVISMAWRWQVHQTTDWEQQLTFPMWLPGFIMCFLAGAALAHVVVGERNGKVRITWLRWLGQHPLLLLGLAAVAASIGTSPLGGSWGYEPVTLQQDTIRTVANTVLVLLLLVGVSAGRPGSIITRLLSARWLEATGLWSYGIYLWHLPVMVLLGQHISVGSGATGLALWLAINLAVSVPLGALSYILVERPASAYAKAVPLHRR